jgi:hypothetical protein
MLFKSSDKTSLIFSGFMTFLATIVAVMPDAIPFTATKPTSSA